MATVRQLRWSRRDYYRLGELGFFRGRRVELIKGRILTIEPKTPRHSTGLMRVDEALRTVLGLDLLIRTQAPLDLGEDTEPEPDLLVVPGPRERYRHAHPTMAALIVEVSDTTTSYDRRHKGSLYARAGIVDYWLVNLKRRRVEVYRDPIPDSAATFGHRYSSRTDLLPGATVSPMAVPQASIAVADLLG